jgi:hypothetical protein
MQGNVACSCRRTVLQMAVSLGVLGAIMGQAGAQQPTKAQENALRSACRSDFMAHCSRVKPSGPAAMACLQRNAASLSARCRTAMSAIGGRPAPTGTQPASRPGPPPIGPGGTQATDRQRTKAQESAVRSACRNDFMAHCSRVKPSGPAAMACLQRNAASLSPRCRAAVSAASGGSAPAGAQPAALPAPAPTQYTNIAFVEAVSGRVLAFARGKPSLLGNSDIVTDHTQLDLQANSELRLCHYRGNRLLTLRGPLRAMVSADGVTDESGRAVDAAAGTCTSPGVSR